MPEDPKKKIQLVIDAFTKYKTGEKGEETPSTPQKQETGYGTSKEKPKG